MNRVLLQGAILGTDPTVVTETPCWRWNFLRRNVDVLRDDGGVEPTNNYLERLLRVTVLWRKGGVSCWSVNGCRFVERILTVVQTRRLQAKNVLDYLHEAVLSHRTGQPCPSLLS